MTVVDDPARPSTPAALAPTVWQRIRRSKTSPHVLLAAAFAIAWTVLSVCRILRGADMSYDTAIFTEAVKGWATHGAPIVDIKGAGFNLLGDHWSPILAVLAPAWWVWPSPLMLLTVQALLFGWSVGVVSETAARFTSNGRGLAIGLAYGLAFGMQRAVDAGFHEIAFSAPLLAVVMRQLLLEKPVRAALWALPLPLVKEDFGLTVAVVGVIVAVRWRRWALGAILAVVGLASVAGDVLVFIPAFNPQHHYAYWAKVPGHHSGWRHAFWATFWPPLKWQTAGWTAGVTGFVCLRSPLATVAAPILLWRFASSDVAYWDTGWHYSAPVMPTVFLAAVDGLRRMERSRRRWQRRYWFQAVPAIVATAVACTVALPLGLTDVVNPGTYLLNARSAAMARADAVIPPGMVVSADNAQCALLAARDTVYWVGDTKLDAKRPDYIAMDASWWKPNPDLVAWATQAHPGTRYRIAFRQGDFTVLQRIG